MTNEVYLYEMDNGQLVRINPTNEEKLLGRRMAATLRNMINDMFRKKQTFWTYDSSIGRLEIELNSVRKSQRLLLSMPGGELNYIEARNSLVLACQYMAGEYPFLVVDLQREKAEIVLPSGRTWASAIGLV